MFIDTTTLGPTSHSLKSFYCMLFLHVIPYRSKILNSVPACHLHIVKPYEEYEYLQEGDIVIGGVFTVHNHLYSSLQWDRFNLYCQKPNSHDYVNLLMFLFAVERINADPYILPNITLGYHIFDSCLDTRKAVKSVIEILSGPRKTIPNYSCTERNKVAGFIGDHHSLTTVPMAQILGLYGYAQISYGATHYLLSDRRVYPHFFRMLQNDRVHYKIISQLLIHFGWTWVGILASDDDTGETESRALRSFITSRGLCVAFSIKINLSYQVFSKIHKIAQLVHKSSAHTIILCGSYNFIVGNILATQIHIFNKKTIILPPSWASNIILLDELTGALNGSLAIKPHQLSLPELGGFFDDITPSNYPNDKILENIWMDANCASPNTRKNAFHESVYKVSLANCSNKKFFARKHLVTGISSRVFYSVLAMAHALNDMDLSLQRKNDGRNVKHYCCKNQLYRYIKNIKMLSSEGNKYLFDEHGEFAFHYSIINWIRLPNMSLFMNYVGNFTEWAPEGQQLLIDSQAIIWKTKNNQIPRSRCSENCSPGYRKVPNPGIQSCCYHCIQCSEGEISITSDSENCLRCLNNEWPNGKKDRCLPKLEEFLSYTMDVIAVLLSLASVLFCLVTAVILIIFIVFRDTPIVKANNKNLSFLLLVSLMLSFLCVFLFLGRPVDITCMLRQTAFGIIFSVAVSSVLAKTIMVCISFKATRPESYWRKCVGVKVSNTIVLLCSSVQILINVIWLSTYPPFQEFDTHTYQGKIIIQCNEGSAIAFYCVLGYMGLLAAVSFIIAFLARTLPDSFNEAKYITFSMLVFCSVWIAMIPAYLSTKGKYMVAVEVFAILASCAGLVGCIFLPKCYIILFRPKMNTKAVFMKFRNKKYSLN